MKRVWCGCCGQGGTAGRTTSAGMWQSQSPFGGGGGGDGYGTQVPSTQRDPLMHAKMHGLTRSPRRPPVAAAAAAPAASASVAVAAALAEKQPDTTTSKSTATAASGEVDIRSCDTSRHLDNCGTEEAHGNSMKSTPPETEAERSQKLPLPCGRPLRPHAAPTRSDHVRRSMPQHCSTGHPADDCLPKPLARRASIPASCCAQHNRCTADALSAAEGHRQASCTIQIPPPPSVSLPSPMRFGAPVRYTRPAGSANSSKPPVPAVACALAPPPLHQHQLPASSPDCLHRFIGRLRSIDKLPSAPRSPQSLVSTGGAQQWQPYS